mmetsp:Transcript_6995/g.12912  ORF Transcript_6995/g.12912 Transcript_6995/m.12912 type:complete len:255 (+) Transcript_6995:126-890(+)
MDPDKRVGVKRRTSGLALVGFLCVVSAVLCVGMTWQHGVSRLGRITKRQKRNNPMYVKEGEMFKNSAELMEQHMTELLPWNYCKLTKQLPDDPVVTPQGIIYELPAIASFISKHQKCPETGKPLRFKDLTRVKYHRNKEFKLVCPITKDELTPNSKVLAIRTSGNIYTSKALGMLCNSDINSLEYNELIPLKANQVEHDPMSGEAFTREDIIVIQDPEKVALEKGKQAEVAEQLVKESAVHFADPSNFNREMFI